MLPNPYRFLSPAKAMEIDQVLLAAAVKDDPIFTLFPQKPTNLPYVRWTQRDSYFGLMQARNLNGAFPSVPEVGSKTFMMSPGYYGEHRRVTEEDLTLRGDVTNAANESISLEDLEAEAYTHLLHRDINRERYICWQLLLTGRFRSFNAHGTLVDLGSFTPKRFVPTTPWTTSATATPLGDLRTIAATYSLGTSTSFGSDAEIWSNQTTFNAVMSNTNPNDLGGVKLNNSTLQGIGDVNTVFQKNNVPTWRVFNQSYLDDGSMAGFWIPDGYFVLVGTRPNNDVLGQFQLTKNVNVQAGRSSGFVTSSNVLLRTVVKGFGLNEQPPVSVEFYRGFNGGPALFYPSSYVIGYVF